MGGKGSGRVNFYDEKAIQEVVNMSVNTIKRFLESDAYTLIQKASVAQAFAVRRVANKIENHLEGCETRIIIVRATEALPQQSPIAIERPTIKLIEAPKECQQ